MVFQFIDEHRDVFYEFYRCIENGILAKKNNSESDYLEPDEKYGYRWLEAVKNAKIKSII